LHAEQVASSLHGLVAEIRIVGFREMPAHGDVSDWLALGRNKAELVARAQAAPRYDAVEFYVTDTLQLMEFEPIRFVVPGLIAEGLTLFAGKPKIGKSWLVLHAACAVATFNANREMCSMRPLRTTSGGCSGACEPYSVPTHGRVYMSSMR
jgi:hypothetical protein